MVSCLNPKEKIVFHYPNNKEYIKSENNPKLTFELFQNFNELIDSLEFLNFHEISPIMKIENGNNEYNFVAKTIFHKQSPPILLKFKNILSVSKDSIYKGRKLFPIDSLANILKRDLLNFSTDEYYSVSPDKLMVSVTSELNHLKPLLIKIFNEYNKIKEESKESISLNIYLNRRVNIYPIPPPPENKKTFYNNK